ncbi:MAG TPA: HAD family phosphatase [Anaerolineales bacterium]|nr:HAD family phosphatase [Anaerolineales bacterium]
MIKALIFDFDGLILDTESPEYFAWLNIYQEHGYELPHEEWGRIIGGYGLSSFDAADHLSHLSQGRLDSAFLRARHRLESDAAIGRSPVLPGVLDYIQEAKRFGLKLAIASSSHHAWVDTHAKRLGIFHHFDKVICADDVGVGRTKPNPDLFLTTLNQLQVRKDEAVVFEDSPNGVKAANRAGIFVVAVPNPVTAMLNLEGADRVIQSLADLRWSELFGAVK